MTNLLTYLVAAILSVSHAQTKQWHHVYTRIWRKEAICVHQHESVNWHRVTDWLGYPSSQHGGMQIAISTWQSIIAKLNLQHIARRYHLYPLPSDPAQATPEQQFFVSWFIWLINGHRFGGNQWPNSSRACGVY